MSPDAFFEAFQQQSYEWINAFARQVEGLPVPYAFGAGMMSTVNPCGFIMLPSFAAFYTTAGAGEAPNAARSVLRSLQMGAIITVAFVVTFGLAGVIISGGGRFIMHWIGWAGLAVGVALIALGVYQLVARRSIFGGATANVRVRRSSTTRGVIAFGIVYAVASLSCTLPVFMIVVGSVFVGTGGYVESVGRFVQYAAGMGVVLTVITVGVAVTREQTTRTVGRVLPYVETAGNVLLLFAGSYLVWYWTGDGGVL